MAELVVAPRKAITVLILVSEIEMDILTMRMISVHITFFTFVNGVPKSYSMESLVGRITNGVAKRTTIHMPKSEK